MTRQETGIIMDILTTAYPAFYNGRNAPDMRMTVNLWAEMFAEDDVKIVAAAVKALIATDDKGFPPHIGAVKNRIRQISNPDEMTEQEAWTYIAKALRNSSYNDEEEFSHSPGRGACAPAVARVGADGRGNCAVRCCVELATQFPGQSPE